MLYLILFNLVKLDACLWAYRWDYNFLMNETFKMGEILKLPSQTM